MSDPTEVQVLLGELRNSRAVLERIGAFHDDYCRRTSGSARHATETAIVLADILVSAYTCLETLFLRISQHFENTLARDKWHSDLLHKMTLEVPGVRPAVISADTFAGLEELLKFRHFKRYYFEFRYDWDRLEYLQKRFEQARPLVDRDLDQFQEFLQRLTAASGRSNGPEAQPGRS
jgi:hypothetical protein